LSDLSAKQLRFVEEYLLDLNATQAAIRAGYSERTAHSQGPRLLENVGIVSAIEEAKAKRSERTKIDADWLLRRLADEATADIADLYDDSNNLKDVKEWPLIWRQGLVQGVEIEALFEGHGKDREQTGFTKKLKLSDRIKRLELIGKHIDVQAFREKVEIELTGTIADRLTRAKARLKK
jgi:phage terminase small subunit